MQYTTVLSVYPVTRKLRTRTILNRFDDALRRVFGCHHRRLSRPFTRGQQTYIACLKCGLHREFDLEAWKPSGRFYADPVHGRAATVKPMRLRKVS